MWRNKKTRIVHGHSNLTGKDSGYTACGLYRLWGTDKKFTDSGFEYVERVGDQDWPCKFCIRSVRIKRDLMNEWLQKVER